MLRTAVAHRSGPCTNHRGRTLVVHAQLAPGTKVRVNTSVIVYHAAKHKDGLDLKGYEGVVVSDVRQYNGEELSANLPYKTEVKLSDDDGKGSKLVVHLVRAVSVLRVVTCGGVWVACLFTSSPCSPPPGGERGGGIAMMLSTSA